MIDTTRALFDRAWTPLLVTDSADTVCDANPAAGRLLGRPVEALAGRPLRQFLPLEACTLLTARRAARPEGYVDAAATLTRGDGQRLPVRVVSWSAGPPDRDVICCVLPLGRAPAAPPPQRRPPAAARGAAPVPVTPAEARILEGLALGLTNVDLGHELHLSRQGLDYHIDRLRRRLTARTRPALVARAYVTGLLDPAAWPPRARLSPDSYPGR
jgi:DNA-binding CsgD family transcriptional regulator